MLLSITADFKCSPHFPVGGSVGCRDRHVVAFSNVLDFSLWGTAKRCRQERETNAAGSLYSTYMCMYGRNVLSYSRARAPVLSRGERWCVCDTRVRSIPLTDAGVRALE